MKQAADRYVVSFQSELFYKARRYHWMICRTIKPDELVSWGHAPTQELAENAAQNEVKDLSLGLTQGGQVPSQSSSVLR